jgi:hypothetical protein
MADPIDYNALAKMLHSPNLLAQQQMQAPMPMPMGGGGPKSYANPALLGARTVKIGGKTYSVRHGVDFSGKEYAVINRHTGEVVGAYKNGAQARAHVDRIDGKHGSYIANRAPLSFLEPGD